MSSFFLMPKTVKKASNKIPWYTEICDLLMFLDKKCKNALEMDPWYTVIFHIFTSSPLPLTVDTIGIYTKLRVE